MPCFLPIDRRITARTRAEVDAPSLRSSRRDVARQGLHIDSFLKVLIRGLILLAALVINVYAQELRAED